MEPPIFLLSPPRSFTTVTCAMLGNHPQMFGLAETNLFVADTLGELSRVHRFRRRLQHGLLRSIAELGFAEQSNETVEAVKAWLGENADMSTVEMFATLAEWAGARSLVEKSPLHVYKAGSLLRMQSGFPDAYYLHLTRHPVSMFVSSIELRNLVLEATKNMKHLLNSNVGGALSQGDFEPDDIWLKPHLTILEFLEGVSPERQLLVRGEDLLENPRFWLAQICEWAGKRHDDEAIEAMLHPEESPFATYGPSNARYGNDPKFMESPALRPFKKKSMPLEAVTISGKSITFSPQIIELAKLFGY